MNWQFKGVGGPSKQPYSATFKAILKAVDTSKTLQTKCKTCFGVLEWFKWFLKKKTRFEENSWIFFPLTKPPSPYMS